MSEQTIQDKIKANFMNAVLKSSKFTKDEVESILVAMSTSMKADKMAESILKSIGGNANEDT
jgi:hypothetical protein